jgi:hypothetical protein
MPRLVKILLLVVAALLVAGFAAFQYMKVQTKKASPEDRVTLVSNGLELSVNYSRPFKKGRDIFGGLVQHGVVWRTGANEATTFTTNAPIGFGGMMVEPGTYTLWTIPGPDQWKVILNNKQYGWGVSWGGVASREAAHDVATAVVPVETLDAPIEQFTIRFVEEPLALVLEWDDVRVTVPMIR